MAAVTPSVDQTADVLQNLNLDSQTKASEVSDATKKTSVYQYGSANLGNVPNGQLQQSVDPNICYTPNGFTPTPYYYGNNNWDDYSRYANSEGMDMSAVYGGSAPVMYHNYAYPTYGPYSPAATPSPTMGNDGQIYGPQHYQYPSYFHPTTTSGPMTSSSVAAPQDAFSTSTASDQKTLSVETSKGNSNGTVDKGVAKANNGPVPFKPTFNNSCFTPSNVNGGALPGGVPASGFQGPTFGFDGPLTGAGVTSSFSKSKNSSFQRKYNQNSHYMGFQNPSPVSGMGSTHGFMNRMYPNGFYGHYGGAYRSGIGYGSTSYGSRTNGRGWLAADGKYRPRGRGYGEYGNENVDGLNELNRGPRSKGPKNQSGFVPGTCTDNVQNGSSDVLTSGEEEAKTSVFPGLEELNKADFSDVYADAKFFIIKSYSEDDVHKSIKYNVWASTPNGNKKLDASYRESQQLSGGCPVFLFFSVNTSGQFVGLAEMMAPVDFDKTVEYWQQDKWTGCFPVKWHIVKDVPNNFLKHIILENNENKPVTNSRDTQEVKLEHGLKMIKIFKEHSSKTSILDDFGFYEAREKIIQEKKAKQQQQFQKLVLDGKPMEEKKETVNGSQQVSSEVAPNLSEEPTSSKLLTSEHHENGLASQGDDLQGGKAVVSEEIANGISNGC